MTMLVVYKGRHRNGCNPSGIPMLYGEPIEVDDSVGAALVANHPDVHEHQPPKSTAKKKADS